MPTLSCHFANEEKTLSGNRPTAAGTYRATPAGTPLPNPAKNLGFELSAAFPQRREGRRGFGEPPRSAIAKRLSEFLGRAPPTPGRAAS